MICVKIRNRPFRWIRVLLLFLICLSGCGKRQIVLEQRQPEETTLSGMADLTQDDPSQDHPSGKAELTQEDPAGSAGDTRQDTVKPEKESEVLLQVFVCGAVQRPGVYPLPEGARVIDALQAAGGLTGEADPDWLNQAALILDGEKIRVYTREETAQMTDENLLSASGAPGEAVFSQESTKTVNINTADSDELMTLSGIGQAKADAIIRYREEHGFFATGEEIMQVQGIGPSIYDKIRDYITTG